MIKNLRIFNDEILPNIPLLNLGKVNIICGRNSSGKTTLLEAINSPKCLFIGREIKHEDIEAFYRTTLRAASWNIGPNSSENEEYQSILTAIFQSRQVWFANDNHDFYQEMMMSLRSSTMPQDARVSEANVLDEFVRPFTDKYKTVLISPKRQVDAFCPIKNDAEVKTNGEGLIQHLFYAKDQPTDDSDRQIYDAMYGAFNTITGGSTFEIYPDRNNGLSLYFTQPDGSRSLALSAGLGLQELLVILYFACQTEYPLVLIEEPETHLHPEWQRKLLSFLRKNTGDKQFFITTHSSIFLDPGLTDRVFLTSFNGTIHVEDETSRASMLADLGYSVTDNLVSDLIILVEGPKDVQVIEAFLITMEVWQEYIIKIWSLGGDIMDQNDLSVWTETRKVLALIDSDPGSKNIRDNFSRNCEALNISITRLNRYAMENYLSLRAIREVYARNKWENQFPGELEELAPNTKVQLQLGGTDIKRNIRMIAAEMTLQEIEGTDDLYAFLQTIHQECQG